MNVRPKKHLGQHFLTDLSIAKNIADALQSTTYNEVLEIGPGMGVLTQYLLPKAFTTSVIEIDTESVGYLKENFPLLENRIIEADFLKIKLKEYFDGQVAIIGNFPYNISSQILFRVIEQRTLVPEFAGMFQKEVAERICEKPGSKAYGIISDTPKRSGRSSKILSSFKLVDNPNIFKLFLSVLRRC